MSRSEEAGTVARDRIGRRDGLATPVLVADLSALDSNIAEMARWASAQGIAMRPHAKTHKCSEIARRQLAAGAVGICCAKLGEAEALAADGIGPLLITSPIVSHMAIERLATLSRHSPGLIVVTDSAAAVERIAAAIADEPLGVLVDIDPGHHRTGVTSAAAAVELAALIASKPSLAYNGVQFYCGPHQHIRSFAERRQATQASALHLRSVLDALAEAGFAAELVTGGGTGTYLIDAELGVLNELQLGSYVFLDREYLDCEFPERGAPRLTPALMIDTRVISANTPRQVTVDAGWKAMSSEAGPPRVLKGAHEHSLFAFMGDEHGAIFTPEDAADPELDQRIVLLPPHCDPTVNLYDEIAICEGDFVIDFWAVTARGRSS